jgi:hypothetical protein
MFRKLMERFKEEETKLIEEAVRLSRLDGRAGTNWPRVIFWVVVVLAGGFLYLMAGNLHRH